jgi:hypothetical protein
VPAAKAAVTAAKGKISKIRRRSVLRSIDNHPHQFSAAGGSKRDNNTHMAEKNTLDITRHAESHVASKRSARVLAGK